MRIVLALAATLAIAACAPAHLPDPPAATSVTVQAVPPLAGVVQMSRWSLAATIPADIAPGATVSLIDPATGFTLSGALTDASGHFGLNFSNNFSAGPGVYILEAVKGLKDAIGFNAPGSAAARVRTLVRLQAGVWQSLSNGGIVINTGTTALTGIAGLKGLKDSGGVTPLSNLFGTLSPGAAEGTEPAEGTTVAIQSGFIPTADISTAEYHRAYALVSLALGDDADPIGSLFYDAGASTVQARFQRTFSPVAVTGFQQAKANRGQAITLMGQNLGADGEVWFTGYQGSISSDLARVPVKAAIGALSADRRTLQVTVPASACSGQVVYRRKGETYAVANLYPIVGTIVTVAGTGTSGWNGDGLSGDVANVTNPYFMTMGPGGIAVWSEVYAGRVRSFDPRTGIVTTLAGNGGAANTGDGGLATAAQVGSPVGVAYDSQGNLAVGDFGNSVIRKVNAQTGIISTIAGTGAPGFTGDGGPAISAQFDGQHGIAYDLAGNLFVSDYRNGKVRRIDAATGNIASVPSWPGGSPVGMQRGPDGAIYICTGQTYRLDPASLAITTYSTTCGGQDFAIDSAGNLFPAMWSATHQVMRVDGLSKAVTVAAGNGTAGFSGDGGDPLQAGLYRPAGGTIDSAGCLYVADYSNERIRYIGLP